MAKIIPPDEQPGRPGLSVELKPETTLCLNEPDPEPMTLDWKCSGWLEYEAKTFTNRTVFWSHTPGLLDRFARTLFEYLLSKYLQLPAERYTDECAHIIMPSTFASVEIAVEVDEDRIRLILATDPDEHRPSFHRMAVWKMNDRTPTIYHHTP